QRLDERSGCTFIAAARSLVAKRNRSVAQVTTAPGTFERTALKAPVKGFGGQFFEITNQVGLGHLWAGFESRIALRGSKTQVPRADLLADITAEYPVADLRA